MPCTMVSQVSVLSSHISTVSHRPRNMDMTHKPNKPPGIQSQKTSSQSIPIPKLRTPTISQRINRPIRPRPPPPPPRRPHRRQIRALLLLNNNLIAHPIARPRVHTLLHHDILLAPWPAPTPPRPRPPNRRILLLLLDLDHIRVSVPVPMGRRRRPLDDHFRLPPFAPRAEAEVQHVQQDQEPRYAAQHDPRYRPRCWTAVLSPVGCWDGDRVVPPVVCV